MDTRDYVSLTILALDGRIEGKTKLQKVIYFTGVLTNCLDELGYQAHFYGPYSDRVSAAVGQLKSAGVVEQNVTDWGIDRSGFEIKRYDFRLSPVGAEYAKRLASRFTAEWKKIQKAITTYQEAGDVDYMALSIAAKTYVMLGQQNGKPSQADLVKLAPRFGWTVSEAQVQTAAEYLQKLGLLQRG